MEQKTSDLDTGRVRGGNMSQTRAKPNAKASPARRDRNQPLTPTNRGCDGSTPATLTANHPMKSTRGTPNTGAMT